jgi:hypothetical protein
MRRRSPVIHREEEGLINEAEYKNIEESLLLLGSELSRLNLDGFLRRIYLAEKLADTIDPDEWQKNVHAIQKMKRICEKATEFMVDFNDIIGR